MFLKIPFFVRLSTFNLTGLSDVVRLFEAVASLNSFPIIRRTTSAGMICSFVSVATLAPSRRTVSPVSYTHLDVYKRQYALCLYAAGSIRSTKCPGYIRIHTIPAKVFANLIHYEHRCV